MKEELQDVPVGRPLRIKDDLHRLGVTRMVVGGRVVVLPAGVADAGGDDSVAAAQQFLRGPETSRGQDRGLGVLAHRGSSPRKSRIFPPKVLLNVTPGRPASTLDAIGAATTGRRRGRRGTWLKRMDGAATRGWR